MALILVVDDEVSLAEMVCDAINIAGHTAVMANDGAAALAIVRDQRPALIITDVNMPPYGLPARVVCLIFP